MTYEELRKLFKEPEYYPTKFECFHCETIVRWGDVYCSRCENMISWCNGRIRKERNSFIVKV
jgi:hypothetical protein